MRHYEYGNRTVCTCETYKATRVSKRFNLKHYPRSIREALTRKKCLWRRLRDDPNCASVKIAYKSAAAKCRDLIRKSEIKQGQQVITSNNTCNLYKFINRKLSCKSGVGALRDTTGRLVTHDKERANMLNNILA